MVKKTNLFTTIGGIMAGFALIPIAVGTAGIHMPSWLYLICIFVGTLGPVVIGVGAKGQDQHSTLDQVNDASRGNGPPPPVPPSSGRVVAGKSN